jgi:hypothetical protein
MRAARDDQREARRSDGAPCVRSAETVHTARTRSRAAGKEGSWRASGRGDGRRGHRGAVARAQRRPGHRAGAHRSTSVRGDLRPSSRRDPRLLAPPPRRPDRRGARRRDLHPHVARNRSLRRAARQRPRDPARRPVLLRRQRGHRAHRRGADERSRRLLLLPVHQAPRDLAERRPGRPPAPATGRAAALADAARPEQLDEGRAPRRERRGRQRRDGDAGDPEVLPRRGAPHHRAAPRLRPRA